MASSRVGVSTRACTPLPAGPSLSRMGRAKAAVLPVPVCAWPTTSRPSRSSGMVFCWMGEGVSYPTSAIAFSNGSPRPNWSKESARTSAFAFIGKPLFATGGPHAGLSPRGPGDPDRHAGEEPDARGLRVEAEPRARVEREARARRVAQRPEREEAARLDVIVALAGEFGLDAEAICKVARDRDRRLPAVLPTRPALAADEQVGDVVVDVRLAELLTKERDELVVEAARAEPFLFVGRGEFGVVGEGERGVPRALFERHDLEPDARVAETRRARARRLVGLGPDGLEVEVEQEPVRG